MKKRRERDSLKVCLLLFIVRSNDLRGNAFRHGHSCAHLTSIIRVGKRQRYKYATKKVWTKSLARDVLVLQFGAKATELARGESALDPSVWLGAEHSALSISTHHVQFGESV